MTTGTIFLLGGIWDTLIAPTFWKKGLLKSGTPHDLIPFRWQHRLLKSAPLADLWRTKHHIREADRLVCGIRQIRAEKPGEPIHIFAHSAGTALTIYALERLAEREKITSAVLVSSALSPSYDLSAALKRTSAGIMSVESRLDFVTLGFFTSIFGTADRKFTPSAGMMGFRKPSDPHSARKFRRFQWTPSMMLQGWLGGHLSVAAPWFVRGTLLRWVRHAESIESGCDATASVCGFRTRLGVLGS